MIRGSWGALVVAVLVVPAAGGGPANDNCGGPLTVFDGLTPFSTVGATTDGLAHAMCAPPGAGQTGNDIWFRYAPTCTGTLTVSTCEQLGGTANFDTDIVMYQRPIPACPPTDAELVACNDDDPAHPCGLSGHSTVVIPVAVGEQYLIRLGGREPGFEGSGVLSITCAPAPPPTNDLCADALELAVPSSTAGTTIGALADPDAPFCVEPVDAPGVWYTVVGTGHTLTATTCSAATDYDTVLHVYCGCCNGLTCVTGNDDDESDLLPDCDILGIDEKSTVAWCSEAGRVYTILVSGAAGETGDFELTLSDDGVPCVPAVSCPDRAPRLALEAIDCQDDAALGAPGKQISVELWMRDLCGTQTTGYQAFIEYDDAILEYRGDLSAYAPGPFPLHIQQVDQTPFPVPAGELRLDASELLGQGGTNDDSLLATLIFDVIPTCASSSVDFDLGQPFPSELSFEGLAIATILTDSGPFDIDDVARIIICPNDIVQPADADSPGGCGGAVVEYEPGTFDACGPVVVICAPPSGSLFPPGSTPVICIATDPCGNTSFCTFDVTVLPVNEIDVEVELAAGWTPATRCIHFVTDDCGVTADLELAFVDHDGDDTNENGLVDGTEGTTDAPASPVRFAGTIAMPCGPWTQICAKDEQHTLWDTADLALSGDGTTYVATSILSLRPGDTDNDGDADLNDVAFLIGTFGDLALDGDCPWDGTRDADFGNEGWVGSDDYSRLTANVLDVTTCSCALAASARLVGSIVAEGASRRADLDSNGMIDHRDVAIFERREGLSSALSTALRDAARRP